MRIKGKFDSEPNSAYRLLVENLEDYAVFMMDQKGIITTWNKGAEKQFGYKQKEAIGKNFSLIFTEEDKRLKLPQKELQQANKTGRADDERQHVHKNGKQFWCSGIVVKFEDNVGKFIGLSKIVRDISDRKDAEQVIQHQAMHDTLTGLANRRLMFEQLEVAIQSAKKSKEVFALAFVDLDGFKEINDTHGHDTGDLLLQEMAVRLAGKVRQEDTAARFGGDEFVLILRNIKNKKECTKVAKKVLKALQPLYNISNRKLPIKATMGIALCPLDGKEAGSLLKHADAALYQGKNEGGNTFVFYKEKRK